MPENSGYKKKKTVIEGILFVLIIFVELVLVSIISMINTLFVNFPSPLITCILNALFFSTATKKTNTMNPVYSPAPAGVPFTNTKGLSYPGNSFCSNT